MCVGGLDRSWDRCRGGQPKGGKPTLLHHPRGVGAGGLLFFVCSLAVSTFSSAVAAYRVCTFGKGERLEVSLVAGRVGVAWVSIRGGPCCVHPYVCCLRQHICAQAYLLLFLCPWVLVVRVFGGGGAPSGAVWFPPFGYIRVSLIPCFFSPCERPHGLASAGTFACVSWCGVPFFIFPCGALRSGGLFPLSLSHTLLVPWLPRPMRVGDSSGCARLLVVAWRLCSFPRALTSAPLRRVAAWRIV